MADFTKEPMQIKPCTCEHSYQDAKYGKGMRAHNPFNGDGKLGFRCTVCGKPPNLKAPWYFNAGKLVISPAYKISVENFKRNLR